MWTDAEALLGCAVVDVFTHFVDAFFRVVQQGVMVGAPFSAPVVEAVGFWAAAIGLCR